MSNVWRKIEDAANAKAAVTLSPADVADLVALDAARTEDKNEVVRASWRYKRIARGVQGESDVEAQARRDDFTRATGDCPCALCGNFFRDHPADPVERDLVVLCDLSRVKL